MSSPPPHTADSPGHILNSEPSLVWTLDLSQSVHTHTQGDRHKPAIVTCHDLGFNRKINTMSLQCVRKINTMSLLLITVEI